MADPLSIGASVVAFVQLADSVIRLCNDYIQAIKDAPKDMQIIIGEVTSLKAILESFRAVDLHVNTVTFIPSLFETMGPVEACRRCLLTLQSLLPKENPEDSKGKSRKITLADLAWPLKQSKARKLLAEISGHKSTLLLAITGDMIHDIKDIKAGMQRIESTITDSQRQEVIRLLESVNPSSLHCAAFKKHEEHTSNWLVQSPEWINWLDREKPQKFLWIHGIPGSGKTVLASFIIEQVKAHCSDNPELCYAYYYCHYSHNQDEGISFLKWIIAKLCRHATWIPAQLKKIHDHGYESNIAELENALEALLERFEMTYVVIDALDESTPRDELLTVIESIALGKRFRNLKVLATSREQFDIEKVFAGISESISMSNPLVEKDIRLFVHSRLLSSPLVRRFKHLLNQIEEVLVTKSQGIFRWAECQIHAIERLRHESQILAALEDLPKDLAETYIRIFQSIPEADWDFVRRALIWICGHAESFWTKDTGINATLLVYAVSYDLAQTQPERGTLIYDCDDLRELCGCLITFSPEVRVVSKTATEKSGTVVKDAIKDENEMQSDLEQVASHSNLVSLAHYTVLEFLASPLIYQTVVSQLALDRATIFSEFALSCIKQALSANPEGQATDWGRDREAYCLTLVCALGLRFYHFAHRFDIQDLFIQYYDPTSNHFARLPAIQQRIIHCQDVSRHYMLGRLPLLRDAIHGLTESQIRAATMLNLLCVSQLDLVPQFMKGKNAMQLLEARISILVIEANGSNIVGTVPEILSQSRNYVKGLIWVLSNYGAYVDATRLLMFCIGIHLGSDCKHPPNPNIEYPFCTLYWLLNLEANSNAPGFKVTPLQIAVYHRDFHAVKLLLNHGANPNTLGDAVGQDVEHCEKFSDGKQPALATLAPSCTPLRILRIVQSSRKRAFPKIERLLMERGGRDIGFEGEVAKDQVAV